MAAVESRKLSAANLEPVLLAWSAILSSHWPRRVVSIRINMPSSTGKEKSGPGVQIAALPYRLEGELHILLVTSRDTGRWVIPKGWPMKGLKAHPCKSAR